MRQKSLGCLLFVAVGATVVWGQPPTAPLPPDPSSATRAQPAVPLPGVRRVESVTPLPAMTTPSDAARPAPAESAVPLAPKNPLYEHAAPSPPEWLATPPAANRAAAPADTANAETRQACPEDCRDWRLRDVWTNRLKPFMQATHWGYADLFETAPFGYATRASLSRNICNGIAAQMVLYQYDFCDAPAPEGARLNIHGQKRLYEIAQMLQCCPYPVLVERAVCTSPARAGCLDAARLNEARQEYVTKAFRQLGVPAHVVVGEPAARGLRGEEATWRMNPDLQPTAPGGPTGSYQQPQQAPTMKGG